mmetsp:Transcript_86999/g.173745  ORF Transcript_86999/g.173745 Transcript_86999/m.173745 type:complete len:315 (-) Transcript_86999:340-1284(-)
MHSLLTSAKASERLLNANHQNKTPPKRFVVAIDGSKLGFRAAKYAGFLCRPATGDKVELVSISDGAGHDEEKMAGYLQVAKNDLLALGFRNVETTIKPKGKSIADTLCEAASGGILVMGAGGMRLQEEWVKKKSTTPAAATGSVAQTCMAASKAPVIICKMKAAQMIDNEQCIRRRKSTGMSIVVAVTDPAEDGMAQKAFDMAKRVSQRADTVHVVHVRGSNYKKSIDAHWVDEASKASFADDGHFQYTLIDEPKLAVDKAIAKYIEDPSVLADLVILSSAELTKLDGQALGSVSAAVAKSTEANVLIAKHFAQ